MQLIEIVHQVLETGELPMNLERRMHYLLQNRTFTEAEIAAIDQLLDAIHQGTVRSVPNRGTDCTSFDLHRR